MTVRGSVFGHNYKDTSDYDLSQGVWTDGGCYSDLCGIFGVDPITGSSSLPNPQGYNVFRILQPHYGEIVECYLDLFLCTYATDGTSVIDPYNEVRVFIGDFLNNDFLTPRTNYTNSEAKAKWKTITGVEFGVGENMTWQTHITKLNLLPLLPKKNDPKYVDDGFALVIQFNNGDGVSAYGTTPFRLNQLRLAMSITGIK